MFVCRVNNSYFYGYVILFWSEESINKPLRIWARCGMLLLMFLLFSLIIIIIHWAMSVHNSSLVYAFIWSIYFLQYYFGGCMIMLNSYQNTLQFIRKCTWHIFSSSPTSLFRFHPHPSDCSDACLWNTCSKQQEEEPFENHHRFLKHLTIWSVVFLCVTYTYEGEIHRP